MRDNIRTVRFSSDEDTDDPIQHNIDLQRQLRQFIRENDNEVFIGRIEFSRRACNVTFETVGETDPDAIVARYTAPSGDDTAGDGAGTGEPPADDTDDPPAPSGDDPGGDTDGATTSGDDPSGDDEPFRLVDEDGSTLATFGTAEEAWDEFENYDEAFDVIEPENG